MNKNKRHLLFEAWAYCDWAELQKYRLMKLWILLAPRATTGVIGISRILNGLKNIKFDCYES